LGMIGHGTAQVRVRAIDPYENRHRIPRYQYAKVKTNTQTSSASYLQVGAFQHQENALRLKDKLNQLITVPVQVLQKSQANTLYHVTVGPFHDNATLSQTRERLEQLGIASKLTV